MVFLSTHTWPHTLYQASKHTMNLPAETLAEQLQGSVDSQKATSGTYNHVTSKSLGLEMQIDVWIKFNKAVKVLCVQ